MAAQQASIKFPFRNSGYDGNYIPCCFVFYSARQAECVFAVSVFILAWKFGPLVFEQSSLMLLGPSLP